MNKWVNEFAIGEEGKIVKVVAEGKIKRRLFDMGVTPGASIVLKKVAPLGDPIEVTLRGYELTLRKDEAKCIYAEVIK
ncbi:MAG: ferrous iron transport protein A [Bacilli bacterium]|nr:ferrous iron transport protein A [Bacilli bacterium]